MICAVSLNPAVDKYLRLSQLARGRHQQAAEVVTSAGGKAINAAGVMRVLGEAVLVVGFFGGYTGDYLLAELAREDIRVAPVRVTADTRTAFVLVEDDGTETEIVEPGAPVGGEALAALRAALRRLTDEVQVVVLSGSVPPGCPDAIYNDLIADVARPGRAVLLDTSRQWLRAALARNGAGPRLRAIKPNRAEAEELLQARLEAPGDFAAALARLRDCGVELPLISNGAGGLYALGGDGAVRAFAPRVPRVNSVGSGDAALGGFAVGLARNLPFADCLRLAAACGTANVLTKECAQVRPDDVARLLPRIEIERV